jgi:hypothetical protein
LKDANGIPIGRSSDNLLKDKRMYEIEWSDGYKQAMAAKTIAEHMIAQVDDEGNRHLLF